MNNSFETHFASRNIGLHGLFLMSMFFFVGCKEQPPTPAAFEPNHLFAHRWAYDQEMSTDRILYDSQDLVTEWFGTPDEPKLPDLFKEDDYAELVSLEKMKPAVGPAVSTTEPGATGLYRQLCVSCHGETGQGRGTVAASQNPYPRDFRRGLFKYKVTPRNSKPLKADLARTLRQGLTGTQMPLFDKLKDDQIDALVEYVVYLSIRGELERKMIQLGAVDELDPEQAFNEDVSKRERLYDVSLKDSTDEKAQKVFKSQLEQANDLLTEVVDSWIAAEERVKTPAVPTGFPVASVTAEADIDQQALAASIEKGRELFKTTGGCSKCHGESGKGDGIQVPDYDEWTKEWTKAINIDYTDIEELQPFLALGGLKPQPLAPRNLVEGKFRGGREAKALHHRIVHGIDGSPMPAAALVTNPGEVGLQPDDVWHLVNYVLSLK
jgi:mono/diheme cytochrome c family protein